jgi:hypothetical protein
MSKTVLRIDMNDIVDEELVLNIVDDMKNEVRRVYRKAIDEAITNIIRDNFDEIDAAALAIYKQQRERMKQRLELDEEGL